MQRNLLIECYVQNSLYGKCKERFANVAKEVSSIYKETKVPVAGIARTSTERNQTDRIVETLFRGKLVKAHNLC